MKRILVMWLLAAGAAWGQDETVHRVVRLKYVEPSRAQAVTRGIPGISSNWDQELKVIALTGKRTAVEMAEAALKEVDIPAAAPKDIDLTVYFVVGRDEAGAGAIPADLQGTVSVLRQTFPYKGYELLDALSLRARSGTEGRTGASTTGQLAANRLTSFSVRAVSLEGDGSMIRIDGLKASVREPQNLNQGSMQYVDVAGVNTEIVDVKEGQKLVVGRASAAALGKALFLVLTARVAQ